MPDSITPPEAGASSDAMSPLSDRFLAIAAERIDAHDADQIFFLRQPDQRDALRVASDACDFRGARAHQRALIRDQHQAVGIVELHGTDQRAVAIRTLDRDHALRAAALARIFGQFRALAETALRGGEDVALAVGDDHRYDVRFVGQTNAAHAVRGAAHRTHFVFGETHRFAVAREQEHIARTVGDGDVDQSIVVVQIDRAYCRSARGRE